MKKGEYVERRGGKRAGAGRKKKSDSIPDPHATSLMITTEQFRLLKEWGGGNASAGLRWLMTVASFMVRKREPLFTVQPTGPGEDDTGAPPCPQIK